MSDLADVLVKLLDMVNKIGLAAVVTIICVCSFLYLQVYTCTKIREGLEEAIRLFRSIDARLGTLENGQDGTRSDLRELNKTFILALLNKISSNHLEKILDGLKVNQPGREDHGD